MLRQTHQNREEMAVRLKEYSRLMFEYPSVDEMSPTYKRIKYVRYADDFIIGVCGSKAECDLLKRISPSSWRKNSNLN